MNNRSYIEFWDMQLRTFWTKDYPEKLSAYLQSLGVETVLDCAGGSGYPAIELKQMGWNITYSDGTEYVVECFKDKAKEAGVNIPYFLSKWEDLDRNQSDTYDAVLCRGNSFIGITTFGGKEPKSFEESLAKMKEAMQAFYNKINTGGLLYIDIPTKEAGMPETMLIKEDTDHETLQGKRTISYDPETRVRTLISQGHSLIDGEEFYFKNYQYPLTSEELVTLLAEAGFSKVIRSPVKEPDFINVFVAFKE